MSKELNEFLSKLKLNEYKPSSSSIPQLPQQYSSLFESFTSLIQDTSNLTKQELKTYSDLMSNHSELLDNIQSNKYLLEIETDITDVSISSFQNELNDLDKEIALYESKIEQEEIQTKILNNSLQISNKQLEHLFLEKQLKDFELNNLNQINSKSKNLNTASERLLSELSLNNNQCHNPIKAVIGSTNIDNAQYNEVIASITSLLEQCHLVYNQLKNQSSSNEDSDYDLNEFSSLLAKLNSVKETSHELNKNSILKQFKLSLERYKNQLINEYITNKLKDYNNREGISGYELEQLIKKVFEIESQINDFKFISIQNTFTKRLYDDVLIKTKQDQIEFIKMFNQIEMIISSLYPYLVSDLQSTQDIYDNITELIDVYSTFQSKIAIKQTYLRKVYSEEHGLEGKITIDERDDIGLFLADMIKGEKDRKKGKAAVYEYGTIFKELNAFIKKPRANEVIGAFYSNIMMDLKQIINQMQFIKEHSCYVTNVIPYNKLLLLYKDYLRPIIEMFLKISKDKLSICSNSFVNLYEAIFVYYNHPEIFNKESNKMNYK